MISAVAAIVVIAAAGVAAVVLLKQPTGEEAVRAYFEKLAQGDADGALTHVLPPETGSFSGQPLLRAAAISDPDTRPVGLEVVERTQTSLSDGDIQELVTVTYMVDETDFRHTILTRQPERGQPFLLEEPFVELRVGGVERTPVYFVNGVPIDSDLPLPVLAFPGVYRGMVEANALFTAQAVDARPVGDQLPATSHIVFDPELAAGAEAAVQAAVNAHLDRCLQDHTMNPVTRNPDRQPTPCPFHLTGDEAVSVNWSLGRHPDITVEPSSAGPGVVAISTETDGLVRYDVPEGWVDDEFEFSFNGLAYIHGGVLMVETSYHFE